MFSRRKREAAHIDISALVDVVFLLLIFFIVTTRFAEESVVEVTLPNTEGELQESTTELPELAVDADDTIWINEEVVPPHELYDRLEVLFKETESDGRNLGVKADQDASWSAMSKVFDACSKLGVEALVAETEPRKDQP